MGIYINRFLLISLLVLSLIVALKLSAFASGIGGLCSLVPFTNHSTKDTGLRERVSLSRNDELLYGSPSTGCVNMIVIHAPGLEKSHIIVRELTNPDGVLSILLCGPLILTEKSLRVTLFLEKQEKETVLIDGQPGSNNIYRPISLPISHLDNGTVINDRLSAYVVDKLGLYWVVRDSKENKSTNLLPTNHGSITAPLGGDVFRGALPVGTAIIFLLVGWAFSCYTHKNVITKRVD